MNESKTCVVKIYMLLYKYGWVGPLELSSLGLDVDNGGSVLSGSQLIFY